MNYYELLGVSSSATEEEIKRAYKREMKKWHPDINKDEKAVSMSMKINEAKDTLLDEIKRKQYDESLKAEKTKTYEKYSSPRQNTKAYTNTNNVNNTKEENVQEAKTVTKWQYLRDYLKYGNFNILKKALVLVLVLLESFFCTILKYLVIFISFFCFIFSNIVIMFFYYLYPIIILLIGVFLYLLATMGINGLINNHIEVLRGIIIMAIVFASSFVLPVVGKKLLSERVFYFLYNKLDIYLFKKIVGYN